MIVYVIEEGEYSDRGVAAVRETLEEAKEYVRLKLESQKGGYEEKYSITCFDTKGCIVFQEDAYDIWLKDGEIKDIRKLDNCPGCLDFVEYENYMQIHAKDEEHARKIAYDKLAELKARKAGIV